MLGNASDFDSDVLEAQFIARMNERSRLADDMQDTQANADIVAAAMIKACDNGEPTDDLLVEAERLQAIADTARANYLCFMV